MSACTFSQMGQHMVASLTVGISNAMQLRTVRSVQEKSWHDYADKGLHGEDPAGLTFDFTDIISINIFPCKIKAEKEWGRGREGGSQILFLFLRLHLSIAVSYC